MVFGNFELEAGLRRLGIGAPEPGCSIGNLCLE